MPSLSTLGGILSNDSWPIEVYTQTIRAQLSIIDAAVMEVEKALKAMEARFSQKISLGVHTVKDEQKGRFWCRLNKQHGPFVFESNRNLHEQQCYIKSQLEISSKRPKEYKDTRLC